MRSTPPADPRRVQLLLLLVLTAGLVGGCAHRPSAGWRTKGLEPAESTAEAIEASFGPRRVALVIGVGEYADRQFPSLLHAGTDAVEVGGILESHDYGGFDRVIVLTTPVQTTQARVLTELVSLRNDLRSQDTLLVYFSGHGTMRLNDKDEPTLFLVTHDTVARDLEGTAIELAELQRFFSRIRAERKALVVDACFHGDGKSAIQPTIAQRIERMDAFPTLSRKVTLGQSEAHLFATSWGRPAREDDTLGHSVYTYYLLQGLTWEQQLSDANRDGLVTVYEAHDFARGQTVAHTDGAQVPEAYFRVVGEKDLVVTGEPEKRLESELALIYFYDTADSVFSGASLSIDGRLKGVFPGAMPVDPGRHRVTITSPEGTVLFDRVISIDYEENIPADAIDQRPSVYRAYLDIGGGPQIGLGRRVHPLFGAQGGGVELNLGFRFVRDPRLANMSISIQAGYAPAAAMVPLAGGGEETRSRHLIHTGLGFGHRFVHRRFGFGIHWRARATLATGVRADDCADGAPSCDPWVVFGQGPYLEQTFRVNRRMSLVIGEELMGVVVDPTSSGDLALSGVLGIRFGVEVDL